MRTLNDMDETTMEIALAEEGWEVRSLGGGLYAAVHGDSGRSYQLDAEDYIEALAESLKRFARERMDDWGND